MKVTETSVQGALGAVHEEKALWQHMCISVPKAEYSTNHKSKKQRSGILQPLWYTRAIFRHSRLMFAQNGVLGLSTYHSPMKRKYQIMNIYIKTRFPQLLLIRVGGSSPVLDQTGMLLESRSDAAEVSTNFDMRKRWTLVFAMTTPHIRRCSSYAAPQP